MIRTMSEQFVRKNIKLSMELDEYLLKHPKLFGEIPDGATIIITLKGDPKFSEQSVAIVRKSRAKRKIVEAQKAGSRWSLKPLQLAAR